MKTVSTKTGRKRQIHYNGDENGSTYIFESGYIYGELKPQPRILKVDQNGNVSVFVDRLLNEPVNDIEFRQNN